MVIVSLGFQSWGLLQSCKLLLSNTFIMICVKGKHLYNKLHQTFNYFSFCRLAKEVQEKNKTIYYLQQQLHVPPIRQVSSDSEILDGISISSHESCSTTSKPSIGKTSSKNRGIRERSYQRKLKHESSGKLVLAEKNIIVN